MHNISFGRLGCNPDDTVRNDQDHSFKMFNNNIFQAYFLFKNTRYPYYSFQVYLSMISIYFYKDHMLDLFFTIPFADHLNISFHL